LFFGGDEADGVAVVGCLGYDLHACCILVAVE
jgi:hypothetical protein